MTKLSAPTVLIVEDDIQAAALWARIFAEWGWQHLRAHTVAQAKERLAEPLNLVTLDLVLPDGSGMEVLTEIRARGLSLPVAIITSKEQIAVADLDALRPDLVLAKPYAVDRIEVFATKAMAAYRSSYGQTREA